MMKKLAILLLFMVACTTTQDITSFEECVEAGNPVMESYPRQCRAGGETFVEEIEQAPEYTSCGDERPEVCTREYRPVCAFEMNDIECITAPCPSFDAVTMSNACTACSDAEVMGHYPGTCESNRLVICEDVVTGFDIEKLAEESGWICVDICPNNFDTYTTQIGAQMCIPHYGEKEIGSWEVCERSSQNCNCVKTYETTGSIAIDEPEFRCVPEQYAERLLFRAGQERLDEQGELSVVIA